MGVSDRSLFLETIKKEALTINEIMERFGVHRNTANSWSKHELVEPVAGSYPRTYKRKDSFASDVPVVKAKNSNVKTLDMSIPYPPQEAVHRFWEQVMANEAPAFDFVDEFRNADSLADLKKIESKLTSSLIIVDYYRKLMEQDGVE